MHVPVAEAGREREFDEDSGITWVDFTDVIRNASAELEKGDMLHADSFNLGDSMSALEMMDPKMDAGVINEKNVSVVPAEECFERGLVDLDPDVTTTLMSMDKLLALEMTWLRGTAMVQTLFTCLYCQRPAAIQNKILKVYCQGTLKTCEIAKRAASRASVYEEEDLSTSTGGFALCEEMTEEQVSASLLAAEEELQKQVKKSKAAEGAEGEGGVEKGLQQEGLLARIRLRRGWFAVVCHMSKGFKSIRAARKSVLYAMTQLDVLRASASLYAHDHQTTAEEAAGSAPNGDAASRAARSAAPAAYSYAFQPHLNLKCMAPSPPRAVRLLTVEEAFDEMAQMLQHIDLLCVRLPLVTTLEQMQHVLFNFAAAIHPLPGAIPRSFLRLMLIHDSKVLGSQGSMVQWVRESMLDYKLPAPVLATPEASDFIARVAKVLQNWSTTLCYNLGRQRRRLARNMDDWVQLQPQAEKLDSTAFLSKDHAGRPTLVSMSGAYFTGWMLDQVLVMMLRFLELGLELRLYAGIEYSMVFWYLDYLVGVRLNCQPTVFYQQSREHELATARHQQDLDKERRKKKKAPGKLTKPLDVEPSAEQLRLEMQQAMCRGLFRIVAALQRDGFYYVDALLAASLPLRFHRRFGPLMRLEQPQPLSYLNYVASTDSTDFCAEQLYEAAAESFGMTSFIGERLLQLLQTRVAQGSGAMAEDQIANVQASLAVAVFNCQLARALQLLAKEGRGSREVPLPPFLSAADKEALNPGKRKPEAAAVGTRGRACSRGDAEESPLNPSYACDAAVVRITEHVSFVFGTDRLHPYIAVSLKPGSDSV